MMKKVHSKKAFTLVEMIVSFAIISIVSVMLLGIIVSSSNVQATAQQRNKAGYVAAQELEEKFYSMVEGNTDYSSSSYISTQDDYSLSFKFDGEDMKCDGSLMKSVDSNTSVILKGFWPAEEQTK